MNMMNQENKEEKTVDTAAENPVDTTAENSPAADEVAMYQSPAMPEAEPEPDPCADFLAYQQPDFWENFI